MNDQLKEKSLEASTKLVKNALDKPSKEVGNLFTQLIGRFSDSAKHKRKMYKISYKYEEQKFEELLLKKLNSVPESQLCEPDFQTISLAIENAKHCDAKELKEMFANLMAGAINIEKKNDVHPAFSEIIKQMSPLDARNLKLFKNDESLPVSQYQIRNEDGSYDILMSNVFLGEIGENVDLIAQSVSITNLQRLGLLEITYRSKFADLNKYDIAEELLQSLFNDEIKPNEKRELKKGIIRKTPFGDKFINICLDD